MLTPGLSHSRLETRGMEAFMDNPMDGARLAARGAPITLGGKTYRLVLSFEAVELLESDFGGFNVFIDHLRDKKYKTTRHQTVRKGLLAALVHHRPRTQDLVDFEHEIRGLLEPREMVGYLDALWQAIMEAYPPPIKEEDALPKETASPGNGSITSPQSSLAAATASSGT